MIIRKDFPLSKILWYKVGGIARYLIEAESIEDINLSLDYGEKNKVKKIFFCGLGSNLIFRDDYFDGVVVRIIKPQVSERDFILKGNLLSVFGGVVLDDVIRFSFENGFTGLEWAGGLPGTVGAGVRGNVGAFGKEIGSNIQSINTVIEKGSSFVVRDYVRDALEFGYRDSLVKRNIGMVVSGVTFELRSADQGGVSAARQEYEDHIKYRRSHHPMEYPTCGSVFKNVSGKKQVDKIIGFWPDIKDLVEGRWRGKVSMGYLINRLGFSGYRIGNMQVSTKHANFIVNLGEGKATDALRIIGEIKDRVEEKFGFAPDTEVEVVDF